MVEKITCPKCKGGKKCQHCGGSGLVRSLGIERMKETECRECNRTGRCPFCNGKGYIEK